MNAFLAAHFFINILKQHFKIFFISGIISIVIGTIISFILPVEYESETIILPARHFSVSKMLVEPNVGNQEDYMEIGDDDDLEKLLQIIYSDDLKILLANKMNLWKRWKIENKEYKLYYLKSKWDHYINIYRTNYGSVKIKVYDRHLDTAAVIGNLIVELIDTVQKNMNAERVKTALMIVKNEYDNTISRINEMEDSLNTLRKLGIYDYKEQVKAFSKEYAKAIAKGNLKEKENVEQLFTILQKYGGAYNTWSENLRKYRAKFAVIKAKYDQMLIDANHVIPLKFTVQKAVSNNKKARPIRWLIVLISFVSTQVLVFAYFIYQSKSISYE
ncbi:MAG: Wzz/FepE/Etk N-terminal domain-containing protein [Bacteroidota bacterium]